jgi:hypothetical protein
MMRRFWRIFRLLAVLSMLIAAIAVLLVARGDSTIHSHMLIATALGIGLTVLLGTGLMTLVFLSADSSHDDEVRDFHQEYDEE